MNSFNVIEVLADAMLVHRVAQFVRSDSGAEMTAQEVRD